MTIIPFPPKERLFLPLPDYKIDIQPTEKGPHSVLRKIFGPKEAWQNFWFRFRLKIYDMDFSDAVIDLGPLMGVMIYHRLKSWRYKTIAPDPDDRTTGQNSGCFSIKEYIFDWQIYRYQDQAGYSRQKIYVDLF